MLYTQIVLKITTYLNISPAASWKSVNKLKKSKKTINLQNMYYDRQFFFNTINPAWKNWNNKYNWLIQFLDAIPTTIHFEIFQQIIRFPTNHSFRNLVKNYSFRWTSKFRFTSSLFSALNNSQKIKHIS